MASPGPDPFMCVMCAGLPDAARSGRGRRRDVAYVLCRRAAWCSTGGGGAVRLWCVDVCARRCGEATRTTTCVV